VNMADKTRDAIMRGWENAEPPDGYALWTNKERARREAGRQYLHTYDIRRQWIAAANAAVVAPFGLEHTGPDVDYSPRRTGFHLIDPRTWRWDELLPDPCGRSGRVYGDEPIWVTSATLGLLNEYTIKMVHDGYDVHDSYTADGTELLARGGPAWSPPWTTRSSRLSPSTSTRGPCPTFRGGAGPCTDRTGH